MSPEYLHDHSEFHDLLRAVEHQNNIDRALVEKDYWIMHCLYGLQKAGFEFELKGGTSLSKGHRIIHRFSEDIDIRVEPPDDMDVKTGKNHTKPVHCEGRRKYYDWLARKIKIDGITRVTRDAEFDNETYLSGGIRLEYGSAFPVPEGIKEGVLLELGFKPLEQGKRVRRRAREPADDVALAEPPDLLGIGFDDGLSYGNLAVTPDGDRSVLAYRQYGGSVPNGKLRGGLLHDHTGRGALGRGADFNHAQTRQLRGERTHGAGCIRVGLGGRGEHGHCLPGRNRRP